MINSNTTTELEVLNSTNTLHSETNDYDNYDGGFSEWQLKMIVLLHVCGACLSIFGSSSIIYRICTKHRTLSPYSRIMLALSCSDIYYSTVLAIGNFLGPRGANPNFPWALGSMTSCEIVGLLQQIGLVTVFYNGGLSIYFMLTIRLGVTNRYFARNVEPFICVLPLVYAIGTAVYGLIEDLFVLEENGLICWVDDATYAWFFGAVPILLSFVAIVINNAIIYFHVRTTLRRTRACVLMGEETQDETIAHVAVQAFLYVGSFTLSYFWVILLGIMLFYDDGYSTTKPGIVVLYSIYYFFYPLQGFWNASIFVRPRYVRYRKFRSAATLKTAMLWALFGEEILRLSSTDALSNPNIPSSEKEEEHRVDNKSTTSQGQSSADVQNHSSAIPSSGPLDNGCSEGDVIGRTYET